MSATKVLDLAEKQGLLDGAVVADLRKQVAESKFVVTAEAIAKILVDHGHLTPFQARKLVSTALGEPEPVVPAAKPPAPAPRPAAPKPQDSELGLADSSSHDDIVEMQVAAPVAKPPLAKPPPAKKPSRSQAETRPLDMAPARPAPSRPAPSPLVPVTPPASKAPAALEPIAPPPPAPSPLRPVAPAALQAVDTLDPLQAPADLLTSEDKKTRARPVPQRPKSPWENPTYLLLGGGFFLFLVIVFGLLYFALFRTPVAELFARAGEDYEAGSLGAAKEKYEQFLSRADSKSSDASLARVRLGMIDFRQASGEGRNPKAGIDAANRILPELLKEERFDDSRLYLRPILVTMANASAKAAQSAKTTEKKEELVVQTEEALKLVENASYLPSSLRAEVQPQINQTLDILKAARRSIDQDKDLVKAIAAMNGSIEAKDAAQAYRTRTELLRTYPALEADAKLIEATSLVSAMEQSQVKLQEEALTPSTQDAAPESATVVVSQPSGGDSGLTNQFVATLVQGAVYGFDAKDGKLLWRRYVGYDTVAWPLAVSSESGADLLLVDGQRHALMRVQAATGQLVWRLDLGQPFAPPIVGTENVYVTTADSRIVEINLASGQSQRQVHLPQAPSVSPTFDSRKLRLYQLGQHSTLFVLDAERLSCTEAFYLGHKAGAIFVPPVAVLDHVLVVESPGDDFSLVHALAPDAETKKLKRAVEPIRLKGRVVVPLQVERNRVIAATDQGQVAVLQVEPNNKDQPVRQLAVNKATGNAEAHNYFAIAPGQAFVSGKGVACLEIQATNQELVSTWQLHAGDTFVAPPQVIGKVLFHVRRPKSSLATIVEACQVGDGKTIWKTEIAAPVAAMSYDQGRQEVTAVTSRGRVYEIPIAATAGGNIDKPAYVPLPGSESMSLTDVVELGSGKLAILGPQSSEHALVYDPSAAGRRTQQIKFATDTRQASSAATFFQGGLVVPQLSGQVLLLDPVSAGHKAQPYQPPLEAGRRIGWTRPVAIPPDGTALAIADGERTIYRLTIRPQPQPHLESLGEVPVESDVVAPLAASADTVFAVVRSAAVDLVVALQGSELTNAGKSPLKGRVQFGPVSAAGLVFIADEAQLHAFQSGSKPLWSQPLAHGLPALAPLAADSDVLVVTRSGAVCRLAKDSGQELAVTQIGQPAGNAASIVGDKIVVAGADGTLYIVPLPKKP
ncbi:MAG TPA: PQQ-binding-like beta-propeller repeat protein [Pirellulaceae bacterium]|nr:PQQ-binding-like beta-propeller repeat protein [Pirellulaceae bacterium]